MAYSYTMMALEVWNKQEFGQVKQNINLFFQFEYLEETRKSAALRAAFS